MLIEFRASPIHGTGGFSKTTIPPGTRVIQYEGRKITKAESVLQCERSNPFVFYLDEQFDLDGNVELNPARWLNHSCSPNCEAELIEGSIWIVAKREIATSEEITFDYGYDLDGFREHRCQCGAPNCIGFILAQEFHRLGLLA